MDNQPIVPEPPKGSSSSSCRSSPTEEDAGPPQLTFLQRQARRVARYPRTHLWTALGVSAVISTLGMYLGDFHVAFESIGWPSRGTTVSTRATQWEIISRNRKYLAAAKDNEQCWEELTTNEQLSFEIPNPKSCQSLAKDEEDENKPTLVAPTEDEDGNHVKPTAPSPTDIITLLEQCDTGMWTTKKFYEQKRLWPVYKITDPQTSALDPSVFQAICEAEQEVQRTLFENELCFGCDNGQCLPPLSMVLYARFQVPNGFALGCQELAAQFAPLQQETKQDWAECVAHMRAVDSSFLQDRGPCSSVFSPSMVDENFDVTGRVSYTSSIFATKGKQERKVYQFSKDFPMGNEEFSAAYDSQWSSFVELYARESIPHDVLLIGVSALFTTMAMLFHTRSPFLTLIGILQINLSFPLAFTIYRFVGGITWFPFLNLVGLFVCFALGADHVFVAVDKWKDQRYVSGPSASTEDVAQGALPGAGRAMMLTTITTAVAFFGSSICPIAPIKLFAIFVGLLIVIDYILDVVVMFPCLCIYDECRHQRNCFMSIQCGSPASPSTTEAPRQQSEEEKEEEDAEGCSDVSKQPQSSLEEESEQTHGEENHSLIRHILESFYSFLHRWRWFLLLLLLASLAVFGYFATTLTVPISAANIQLLVDTIPYQQNQIWRKILLSTAMLAGSGSWASVVYGLKPADTGSHLNPYSGSTLELDQTFDPSSEEAQIFMRDMCNRFLMEDFAQPKDDDYVCAYNQFENWLQVQSNLTVNNQTQSYLASCAGATGVPLQQDTFHACISAWALEEGNNEIFVWGGRVRVISFDFRTDVTFASPNAELKSSWDAIEDWMNSQGAPTGVDNGYFSGVDWIFWDTSTAVYQTAVGSGAIAIIVSAMVIMITSRSLSMMFFSGLSVAYVLLSVSSVMSFAGWTLGFLESICFTILIGLSADFVLHFSHAYCELPSDTDRHTRTKYALIHLGPSILAAGFTTLVGAFVMLFTYINFFRLFALVLFFTIVQATIGSFVFFFVLTECFGPSNPTHFVDCVTEKAMKLWKAQETNATTPKSEGAAVDGLEEAGKVTQSGCSREIAA